MSAVLNSPLRVLVTGANGQVGRALVACVPDQIELMAVSRAELDIANSDAVLHLIDVFKPGLIINAAGYTLVDKAERDLTEAARGNIDGPRNLARAASTMRDTRIIHLSSDFVFDGERSSPYLPEASTAPVNVYGQTKLAGEKEISQILGRRSLTLRTAWAYGSCGKNFLHTMLRLMKEHGAVRVIADQVGTPTSSESLAQVLWQFAVRPELSGIFHWTDAGVASWYDFAVAIAEEAVALGLLESLPKVEPIATHEYPTPARRPSYSVLDKTATYAALGLAPVHWRVRLREVMQQLQL